jgi:aminoglycoside phosphotransferase (APT) family kinase protein
MGGADGYPCGAPVPIGRPIRVLVVTLTPGAGPDQDTLRKAADPARVGGWLADRLDEPGWHDCSLRSVGHGRSNITFRVDSPAGAVVLRRPPVGSVAATAHDMGRERRVISALAGTPVPVPAVLAWAEGTEQQPGPVDAPCYVMELVEGIVPLGEPPAVWPGPTERRRAGEALVDVLVALHGVDPAAVGLTDFGRPAGFMARQLRRWSTQWQTWGDGSGTDATTSAELTRLAEQLSTSLPDQSSNAIVHGDYRLDNAVYDAHEPGRIRAVLDWEMSTLGDPLADLGLLMIYWDEPADPPVWRDAQLLTSPSRSPGFPSRAELADRYAQGAGLATSVLDRLPWYTAFGAFKLAVVLAGVLARARVGAVPPEVADGMAGGVPPLVALGHHLLRNGVL